MQFRNRKVSMRGIFMPLNVSKNLFFLKVSLCGPYDTAASGVAQGHVFFARQ